MLIKLVLKIVTIISLFAISACSDAAPADAGKVRIKADKAGAYIYIDGRKKGITGDDGRTNILLSKGQYIMKVEKITDEFLYTQQRNIEIFSDSSIELNFNLKKTATKKRTQRLAQEKNSHTATPSTRKNS